MMIQLKVNNLSWKLTSRPIVSVRYCSLLVKILMHFCARAPKSSARNTRNILKNSFFPSFLLVFDYNKHRIFLPQLWKALKIFASFFCNMHDGYILSCKDFLLLERILHQQREIWALKRFTLLHLHCLCPDALWWYHNTTSPVKVG